MPCLYVAGTRSAQKQIDLKRYWLVAVRFRSIVELAKFGEAALRVSNAYPHSTPLYRLVKRFNVLNRLKCCLLPWRKQ